MTEVSDYFDTPLRRERMQLLAHLIANVEATPYLRAPAGAGKTRFLSELRECLADEYQVVPLVAGGTFALRDQLAEALGLDAVDTRWPAVVTDRQEERPLLLLVDDAQALGLSDIADLLDLAGVGVQLLLAGSGELAPAAGDWEIQIVDLPPFSEAETRAFLQERAGAALDDSVVRALHRAAGGQPGPLLDALDGLSGPGGGARDRSGRPWPWIAAALGALVLLGLAWIYQERINAWFEPAQGASSPTAVPESVVTPERSVPPVAEEREVGQPLGVGEAVAPAAAEREMTATARAPSVSVPQARTESPSATVEDNDPILDAIIDEAIRAAAQSPSEARSAQAALTATKQPASAAAIDESSKTAPGPSAAAPAHAQPASTPASAVPAAAKPAPVASTSASSAPEAEVESADASPRPPARKAPRTGRAWLLAQRPDHWTLQLVGSRERASIDAFLRRHHIALPHAVFERELDGHPWYSLVAGSYASRDAAVAARSRLPAAIARGGVWPRTFAAIREQMLGGPR